MKAPPVLENELQRLRRLRGMDILDTGAEAVLDSFTRLAAMAAHTPISLISLVDADRQWWKSAVGLAQGGGTPRDISFCGHAIGSDEWFEVEDARLDLRFADNPIVVGPPHVVHYAGKPLVMPGGERLGTLCVIDCKPGKVDARTRALMEGLADAVVQVLLLRESERGLRGKTGFERALGESEAKFRTITNAMPQMVWSTTAQGKHDYYNRQWYDFIGVPEGSNDIPGWAVILHPEDQARAWSLWQHSLATGEPYEVEYRLRHHDGSFRWTLGRALPVRDAEGRVIRWMGTCTDIHDHKLLQGELENANRMKDDFLAMLAHELRNPLSPISTAAQLLLLGADDPANVRRQGELIARQARHMTSLVNDLLDVSRVTRGLVRIEADRVDLKEVVRTALEQTRPRLESRQHQVTSRIDDAPAQVLGDRVRLIQVVSNLLHNAAKYTDPCGHVVLSLEVRGGQAIVQVIDDGNGIDPGLLPHIFGLFTQGKRTPDRAQGGLGLGLALVKSLVELHGGSVEARSPGLRKGATFTVRLPLVAPVALPAPKSATAAEVRQAARSLHVMVVDDNADAAHSLGVWLETHGHRATVMHHAWSALLAAMSEPAEVYVLDIGLPEMDGYELAQRLRSLEGGQGATLVALTGYGQPGDRERAREAGFDVHMTKPMDPDALSRVLAQAADKPAFR